MNKKIVFRFVGFKVEKRCIELRIACHFFVLSFSLAAATSDCCVLCFIFQKINESRPLNLDLMHFFSFLIKEL